MKLENHLIIIRCTHEIISIRTINSCTIAIIVCTKIGPVTEIMVPAYLKTNMLRHPEGLHICLAPITQVKHVRTKIVKIKGGHLM